VTALYWWGFALTFATYGVIGENSVAAEEELPFRVFIAVLIAIVWPAVVAGHVLIHFCRKARV
jgi:hypothetical protein